jgi:predicted Fe-S protein YdhL (DUF1289 family)
MDFALLAELGHERSLATKLALGRRVAQNFGMTPARPPRPIVTPCVKVCAVDGASGYCLGCRRTLPEIAGWAKLSDEERAAIMIALPDRPDPMAALMAATRV